MHLAVHTRVYTRRMENENTIRAVYLWSIYTYFYANWLATNYYLMGDCREVLSLCVVCVLENADVLSPCWCMCRCSKLTRFCLEVWHILMTSSSHVQVFARSFLTFVKDKRFKFYRDFVPKV